MKSQPIKQSIGLIFLFHLFHISGSAIIEPCYDELGHPIRCIPDFVNAAFGKEVKALSDSNTDQSHPLAYLTDLHNPTNTTCWISESFTDPTENISITLSLGKKYELTYVSLQFCSQKPDSMVIMKSTDFGETWQPFQYYSSDCQKVYHRAAKSMVTKANEQEPLCLESLTDSQPGGRVAFSTLEGRPSAYDFDNSPVLQDWVTATDIRIIFNRVNGHTVSPLLNFDSTDEDDEDDTESDNKLSLPSSPNEPSKNSNNANSNVNPNGNVKGSTPFPLLNIFDPFTNETDLSNMLMAHKPEDSFYYAVSDLAVGGRCKCNGHASRCVTNREGQLTCDCKHNTAGRDCEKCKPFHFDVPWARATAQDAHECKPCNCNLHARRCRFNMELYKLSGRKSGGVCLKCRHNTAGRHCHYCREGYYRDSTKPITHRKACKPCECHPVGASGRTCNQTTGQCPCKDGVTGVTCNRCAKGYQQSRSTVAPCVRVPLNNIVPVASAYEVSKQQETSSDNCDDCRDEVNQLSLRKYCRRDFAIEANVVSRETIGDWIRFTIQIIEIYKHTVTKLRRGSESLWVPLADLACKCPKIKIKENYIIIGIEEREAEPRGLIADRQSLVVEWSEEWDRKIRRYQRKQRSGICSED